MLIGFRGGKRRRFRTSPSVTWREVTRMEGCGKYESVKMKVNKKNDGLEATRMSGSERMEIYRVMDVEIVRGLDSGVLIDGGVRIEAGC